jgi:endonuclease YncB( thermonuclease family)
MANATPAVAIGPACGAPVDAAPQLVGRTRVMDGDIIVVGGVHVRLRGSAAPETAHPDQPEDEPGGPEAAAFTACFLDGKDIAAELVRAGLNEHAALQAGHHHARLALGPCSITLN